MLYDSARYLVDPYVVSSLALGAAMAVLWRSFRNERRWRFWPAIAAYFFSLVLAVPVVSFWPLRWIERDYPPWDGNAHGAQAIVVLGGGVHLTDSIRNKAELSGGSTRRCLRAFELYRSLGPMPVFVTGARADAGGLGSGEAEAMYDFLIELGTRPEDLHVEANSSTTHENALFTCRMLRAAGLKRILLVTEALHMRRAEGCFKREGIEVVGAVSSYRTTDFHWAVREFLPSTGGLFLMRDAVDEWLGYTWYRLSGKL